jgi:4-amino-4-deoxy-L-arabinose transferase-like glycosyltransferase
MENLKAPTFVGTRFCASAHVHLDLILPLILFITALWLRLTIISLTEFDGLYGQDAYAYYDFAASLSEGHLTPDFFWPLGYPVLLALGFKLFGAYATAGQLTNVLLGALLSPLVYTLTRQTGGGKFSALLAGTLMLLCGQALQSSLVLMADIPALFWAVLSAVSLWKHLEPEIFPVGTRRALSLPQTTSSSFWLILCAVSLALACITRWLYLALMIPWTIAFLWHRRGKIHMLEILLAGTAAALIFMPQILYSRSNTAPTINHAWVEGWSIDNIFKREFTNIDGHFEYAQENRFFYAKPFYDPYYLAPVFAPFILIGFAVLLRRRLFPQTVMLHLWTLLPVFFLAGIPYQNLRFPLIVFPPLAALASIGFEALGKWIWNFKTQLRAKQPTNNIISSPFSGLPQTLASGFEPDARRKLKLFLLLRRILLITAAGGTLLLGLGDMFSTGLHTVRTFIDNQQKDKIAIAWAADQIPPGSTIYTFGLTLTLKHYTDFQVYELYYETPATLADKWQLGQSDYLLLNVWNIENQWDGREPQIAYHWLRDVRGLTRLGRQGYYTLYRISG